MSEKINKIKGIYGEVNLSYSEEQGNFKYIHYYQNKDKKNNEIFYDMPISGLNNIGYIFDYYKKVPNIKKCEGCKILIKSKSNKQKYCPRCAKEIHKQNKLECWNKNKDKYRK